MSRNKKKYLLCAVDKSAGESHSFVDGMLVSWRRREIKSIIVYASSKRNHGGSFLSSTLRRKGDAITVELPFSRKGIGRFLNPIVLWGLLMSLNARDKVSSIFVRNDPLYLFVCSIFCRFCKFNLVFQSSFPHEISGKGVRALKGLIARLLFRLSRKSVTGITTVSEGGLSRVTEAFGERPSLVIPLMSDFIPYYSETPRIECSELHLVYLGSHSPARRLEFLLTAVAIAVRSGGKIVLDMYGGKSDEIEMLTRLKEAQFLLEQKRLTFHGKVERSLVPEILRRYHVGVCLIPPTPMYMESSATKLAEYLSQGVCVLCNNEIPYHRGVASETQSCFLTEWKESSVAEHLLQLAEHIDKLNDLSLVASKYADENLSYKRYEADFLALVGFSSLEKSNIG